MVLSLCKDILFEKIGAASEGPIKWSVAVSRLFNLPFFCTTKQVRICWMSFFFLLDSCSSTMEVMSVNTSSPADAIYFDSCISLIS